MEETYENAGNWNVNDFHIIQGAAHSPTFDKLMIEYRLAKEAVETDEARIRKLPKPWLSDPYHLRLKREMNRAKGEARNYLLSHPDLLVLG